MKANTIQSYLYSFSLFVSCLFMVVAYQNCSNDAGFNANPSFARPFANSAPPRIGGNENIVIRLNQYPTDTTVDNGDSVVEFEVTTPNGTITDVTCTLDGPNGQQNIDCNPVDTIPLTGLGLGTHTFTIEGTNSEGQTGKEVITWTIFESIIQVTKNISVNGVNDIADIILVVDNSGSMEYEQESMALRMSNMIAKFSHLDYRISVITTTPLSNQFGQNLPYTDGKMLQFADGSYCVTPNLPAGTAQAYLGDVVQRDERGNGWERGIYMTYRTFERSQAAASPESGCLRPNVAKHVIVISDEDETIEEESGGQPNGTALIDQAKSNGNNLTQYIGTIFPNSPFTFHSIIVNPFDNEGAECLAGEGAKYGNTYAALSLGSGGAIGSVCAQDYAGQLEEIGQIISNSAKAYQLACVAVENNGQAGSVTSGGVPIGIPWKFNGNKIEFATELPIGDYVVTHYCFK